jgi:hypothetical protein
VEANEKADLHKGALRIVVPKRPEVVKAAQSIPIGNS